MATSEKIEHGRIIRWFTNRGNVLYCKCGRPWNATCDIIVAKAAALKKDGSSDNAS